MARVRPLVVGGVFAVFTGWIVGTLGVGTARAQDTKVVATSARYQLQTYSNPTGVQGATSYGAYVLDSETGEVFHVHGTKKPTRLGSVLEAR